MAASVLRRRRPVAEYPADKLAGFHSIRVNKQWRLVFRWDSSRGEAEDIYLDDHSYK
jgi:plasmid maintenance system killer protein